MVVGTACHTGALGGIVDIVIQCALKGTPRGSPFAGEAGFSLHKSQFNWLNLTECGDLVRKQPGVRGYQIWEVREARPISAASGA